MKRTIGRVALLLLALIFILAALGGSIGVVELGLLGLLLVAGIVLVVRSSRKGRAIV